MSNSNKKHVLTLNSGDLNSTNKYDAVYHINDEYLHTIRSVQFKSITFANTIFNVNPYNNTLSYELGGVSKTATITAGYYSSTTFVSAFNASQGDITIADNTTTKKFNFTSAGTTKILAVSTVGKVIGVLNDTVAGNSYTGDANYNFIYTFMIHVLSSDLAEPDNLISSNKKKYAIIASIPLDVGYGFIKYADEDLDSSDYSRFLGHQNCSSIRISIVDDQYRTIDMNGSDYILQCTLISSS
jgi:hypothetical protein